MTDAMRTDTIAIIRHINPTSVNPTSDPPTGAPVPGAGGTVAVGPRGLLLSRAHAEKIITHNSVVLAYLSCHELKFKSFNRVMKVICKRSHEDIAQRSISVILYNLACISAKAGSTASVSGGGGAASGGGGSSGDGGVEKLVKGPSAFNRPEKNQLTTSGTHHTSTSAPTTTTTAATATATTTTKPEENLIEKENLSVMLANEHYINVMIQMLRDSKPEAQLVIAQAMRSLCIHPQCAKLLLKHESLADLIVVALLRTSSDEIKSVCRLVILSWSYHFLIIALSLPYQCLVIVSKCMTTTTLITVKQRSTSNDQPL